MLPYTLNRMLERQQAVFERNVAGPNKFGAVAADDWEPLITVPCMFWRWKESGRGPAKEIAAAQRSTAFSEGGLIIAAGSGILDTDRIARLLDAAGNLLEDGPFVINALAPTYGQSPYTQLAWISP